MGEGWSEGKEKRKIIPAAKVPVTLNDTGPFWFHTLAGDG